MVQLSNRLKTSQSAARQSATRGEKNSKGKQIKIIAK